MTTIICGSRSIRRAEILEYVLTLAQRCGFEITEVVQGEAKGVDTLARQWAEREDLSCVSFPADWRNIDVAGALIRYNTKGAYNARAGHDRNEHMALYAAESNGQCIAIRSSAKSRGTMDMVRRAARHGLSTFVYDVKTRHYAFDDRGWMRDPDFPL